MFIELKNHKAHIFNHNEFDDSKQSIILIPGAGMDHRMGKLFNFSNLINKYNILSIDLPGHGYTSGPVEANICEYSLFCNEALEELKIDNPFIVGHSMGGLVALDLSKINKNTNPILMNTSYPLLVGEILLEYAKGNLDQAAEFLTKYGVRELPDVKIKSAGFGVQGSGFYGRSKGVIKSPYGTKVVESDPEREIKLYPLKKIFNQTHKEILSKDLKACSTYKVNIDEINNIEKFKFIFGEKDKLARFNDESELIQKIDISKNVKIIEGCGHFPYFEMPDKLALNLEEIIN